MAMDPLQLSEFKDRSDFEDYLLNSPVHAQRLRYEKDVMDTRHHLDHYELLGYCIACDSESRLLVDKSWGAQKTPHGWIPNWRERLVCPYCQLNCRDRALVHVLKDSVAARGKRKNALKLYAMEEITSFYAWMKANLPVQCVGSEYLGDSAPRRRPFFRKSAQLRHEDAEALSFRANRFDFIVTSDVLEHLNQPQQAISEMMRVLKPGGEIFVNIPFDRERDKSQRRAAMVNGKLTHYLPEQYHGNPLSEKGSLVFYDFGWDFLSWLRAAGFRRVRMRLYWSDRFGYLGDPQFYFHAIRPAGG